ncbi:LytTR family DNA-binding domain-containing protein [Holdemanella biformis]|jgi:DNA-binding LytR/AlgR family response regulator|uniref:LytR/AlgR family response regulator transcription factor n=1 Tax=Holdemanella biformis TaxID=1735 RepID=UPI00319DCB40
MINILICDDEINDANIVKACIENLLDSKNIAYNIEICLNATELIEKSKNVNFLFLDMEINGISGIDMGLKLRTLKNQCHIIITSNYQKYLLDGYSIKPDRYILKPYTQDQFNMIMEPVFNEYLNENRYIMDEKIPGTKIYINDIYYLEYSRKYTYLYLHNRTIKTPYSLSYWKSTLCNETFAQCYKSILVNLKKINYVDKQDVILQNNVKLPVSRFYKKTFEEAWINEMSKSI